MMQVPWQVVAILILLLGFVDWSRSNAIERAAAAEIAAAFEKSAREYTEKTAAMSQSCLFSTSDPADDEDSVTPRRRRQLQQTNTHNTHTAT